MRAVIVALVVLVAVAAATPNYMSMFENFKREHSRQYASTAEESKRLAIFVENMKKAEKLMKVNPRAVFGANEFSDMSAEEFKIRHSGEKQFAARIAARKSVTTFSKAQEVAAAGKAIDWRTKGAVTAIKNQGQCGSCWSFSSTGSIEGQWFLAGNTLTMVSEQELVSCDTVDSGCNGGLMDNAWGWLLSAHNGAIVTEASYPYVSGNGVVPACSMSGTVVGATINGHNNIQTTETAMAAFVYASGPLSVAVDATSWQTYVSGIMTNCISSQIDHGVLVVGFDDNNSPPYWIVKNSWGVSWGENGYIRIQKGTDQCLITSLPCTSTVGKGPNPPGPSPPNPSPPGPSPPSPSPPGPSPPSPSSSFTQKTCSDDKCQNCQVDVLPQNSCITGNSSSFIAVCINGGLLVSSYSSNNCQGSFVQTVNPINQCSIVFQADHAFEWVMNNCGSSPSPPGPSPPTPPPSGSFIQEQCSDAACSPGCQKPTFPLNVCLPLSYGGSAIAQCNSQGLLLTEYPLSSSCTGTSVPDQMQVNVCLQDSDGTYFENFCTTSSPAPKATTRKLKKVKKN
jgi:C1A family cysteine protease